MERKERDDETDSDPPQVRSVALSGKSGELGKESNLKQNIKAATGKTPAVLGVMALLLLSMLLLLSIAGGNALAAPPRTAATMKTAVRIRGPFTSDGGLRPGLRLGNVLLGQCWTGSIGSQRRNAWRCMSGNVIHDPCFTHAGVKHLICMHAPWSRTVARLKLTRPLPARGNKGIKRLSYPWGFKLVSGRRCVLIQGTAASMPGVLLPYECSGHAYATRANTQRALWRVRVAPDSVDRLRVHPVRTAWF